MSIIKNTSLAMPQQVLDPRLLGRPVHLLPQFAVQLADDLAAALRQPGLRRYWDGFALEAAAFEAAPDSGRSGRWLRYDCGAGLLGFALERPLLLALLNQRYGQRGAAPAPVPEPSTVRVTATEDRLAIVLGGQLASVFARRVHANLVRTHPEAVAPEDVVPKALPAAAPGTDGWTIGVTLRQAQGGASGRFWLSLDQALLGRVMLGLLPERARAGAPRQSGVALPTVLQLTLEGRLISKEITLETLFALKLGDIIPVTMGRADVLLAESRLFTAAVTEHNGTLCLTAFEETD